MIDTDKYENITPERWTVDEEDPCRVMDAQECTIARTDFVSIDEEREWQLANAQLIADAPLFLAEVERLREVNDDLICELQGFQEAVKEDEAGYKDLVASLEGIEEELKAEVKRLQTIIHEIEYYNGVSAEVITASSDAEFVDGLLAEVKRLRENNETLRKMDWEYECLWTWLAENTNLLNTIEPLMEEWKKEMIE